jgi:hypothetical protein
MPETTDALVRALSRLLADALAHAPGLASDPEGLARRIAPGLERKLGLADLDITASPGRGGAERAVSEPASPRELLLAVVAQHPAGRSPGLPPDALRALTGLPLALLGETVSALVQSGDLVRDAWLVHVPESGDLLPHPRLPAEDASGEADHSDTERRAIGDRRRLGERRLYERRH